MTSSKGAAGRRFPSSTARPAPSATLTVPLSVDKTVTGPDGKSYRIQGTLNLTVTDVAPTLMITGFDFLGSNPITAPGSTTVRVTVSAPVTADTPVILTSSNAVARPDPLTIRSGSNWGSASVYVGSVTAGSTTAVTLTATLAGTSRTLTLTVLGAAPAPAALSYVDPDGKPLPAGGLWAGSAFLINGSGFGDEVLAVLDSRVGLVTWNGLEFTKLAWSDRQVEAVVSFAVPASSTAPVIIHRLDGVTLTGGPLAVRTPLGAPVSANDALVPPGSRVRQGR